MRASAYVFWEGTVQLIIRVKGLMSQSSTAVGRKGLQDLEPPGEQFWHAWMRVGPTPAEPRAAKTMFRLSLITN
jgi:hypothetical protein